VSSPRGLRLAALALVLIVSGCGGLRSVHPDASTPTVSGGINSQDHRDKPYVILISFDGFKPEYLDRLDLPNFRRAMARGARATAMIPVFPSLTFPNHYSLVTGLHPEHHGIVSNAFYDPARDQSYSLGRRDTVIDGTWYRGEPIWATAERQGMVSACYFWPGSEAAIGGVRPTYWTPYDGAVPNEDRVTGVLNWLQLPAAQRPHVITLYFSELDTASHRGPLDGPLVAAAAEALDGMLGLLMDGIESLPIRDRVYLVLTSDHGMIETSAAQSLQLDSLLDSGSRQHVKIAFGGAVANLHVLGGRASALATRDQINTRLQHGRAYLRENLPERYHYRADPRAGDIVIVMNEPWSIATTAPSDDRKVERWGMHGWDPAVGAMHALFVITGPGIKPGGVIPEVENVDIYPLMTELLGIAPAPRIDGVRGRIRRVIMD
jgi:predicted AlkP superfamily pyrophosphatase or phosphodiesterase